MDDFDDPLDLDGDGDVGAFELSILEEESKRNRGGKNNSGCCIVIVVLGSALSIAGWGIAQLFL